MKTIFYGPRQLKGVVLGRETTSPRNIPETASRDLGRTGQAVVWAGPPNTDAQPNNIDAVGIGCHVGLCIVTVRKSGVAMNEKHIFNGRGKYTPSCMVGKLQMREMRLIKNAGGKNGCIAQPLSRSCKSKEGNPKASDIPDRKKIALVSRKHNYIWLG